MAAPAPALVSWTRSPAVDLLARALTMAVALGVLAQAALAGQHLFEGAEIEIHGIIGNVVFTAAVAVLALAVLRREPAARLGAAALLVAFLVAQLGLGYVGRESTAAAALHVPNGVLVFGVAFAQVFLWLPAVRLAGARD